MYTSDPEEIKQLNAATGIAQGEQSNVCPPSPRPHSVEEEEINVSEMEDSLFDENVIFDVCSTVILMFASN